MSFPFCPFTSYPCLSSADLNYHSWTRDCSRYSPTKHTKFIERTKDKHSIIHKINFGRIFNSPPEKRQTEHCHQNMSKIWPFLTHHCPHCPQAPTWLQQPPVRPPASALSHIEGRPDFKTAATWPFQNIVRSPHSSAQTLPWTSQFTQREDQSLHWLKRPYDRPHLNPYPSALLSSLKQHCSLGPSLATLQEQF